jgi:hypothetical protein
VYRRTVPAGVQGTNFKVDGSLPGTGVAVAVVVCLADVVVRRRDGGRSDRRPLLRG